MKCKVCGRTESELESEFGNQTEIEQHQGIQKCSKCIREYETETNTDNSSTTEEISESKDWKDQLTA